MPLINLVPLVMFEAKIDRVKENDPDIFTFLHFIYLGEFSSLIFFPYFLLDRVMVGNKCDLESSREVILLLLLLLKSSFNVGDKRARSSTCDSL